MSDLSSRAPAAPLASLSESLGAVADVLLDHGVGLAEAVEVFEARYARSAVERHAGNVSQAAAALGVHRNTLRLKLQRNGQKPRARTA